MADDKRVILFRRLIKEHHQAVLSYCRSKLGEADAEDATQEVFTVAYIKVEEIQRFTNRRAWLIGVAKNVVRRHWERRQKESRDHDRKLLYVEMLARQHYISSITEQIALRELASKDLRETIENLREPTHTEILRLDLQDQTIGDMARSLSISYEAAKSRLHRARAALGRALQADLRASR